MRPVTLVRDVSGTFGYAEPSPARGLIHKGILSLVWLTFAVSSIVVTEPAPVDALLAGLAVLLPAAGLVAVTPALGIYISAWFVAGAFGYLAATLSHDVAASTLFTSVSLYLYVASFMLAGFVARAPAAHARLILSGWTVAAVIAAAAALVGYFNIIPGAFELFTKFDRASGTFKDPNVFGPFLVAPFLYALHLILDRPWQRSFIPAVSAIVLSLGVLLSFSRGAWINLVVALFIYGVLAFMSAATHRQRDKILGLVLAGSTVVVLVTVAVIQDDKMGAFFRERASLTQSYDEGPTGRFGGQEKAIRLILENPLGIGAGQFTSVYHHEEVHNVFLSMLLNAGWAGGLIYWLMTGLTLAIGLRHVLRATLARPLFLIALSAFLATAAEGIVIDTDHWRSYYILMAMVWGMASSPFNERARLEV